MVKLFAHTHRYNDPPQTVLLAFYLRYPNPYAAHVLSCDVLDRTIDPISGTLKTTRLILKKGIIPRWARRWLEGFGGLAGGLEAWVMEESEVRHDGTNVILSSSTVNISHVRVVKVIEGTHLESASPLPGTHLYTTAEVSSQFGGDTAFSSLVRGRIETWGAARFENNAEKAREGMSLILNLLRTGRPLPNTTEAGTTTSSFSDLLSSSRMLFSSDDDPSPASPASSDTKEGHSTPSPPSFFSSTALNNQQQAFDAATASTSSKSLNNSPPTSSLPEKTATPNSGSRWQEEPVMSARRREKLPMKDDGEEDVLSSVIMPCCSLLGAGRFRASGLGRLAGVALRCCSKSGIPLASHHLASDRSRSSLPKRLRERALHSSAYLRSSALDRELNDLLGRPHSNPSSKSPLIPPPRSWKPSGPPPASNKQSPHNTGRKHINAETFHRVESDGQPAKGSSIREGIRRTRDISQAGAYRERGAYGVRQVRPPSDSRFGKGGRESTAQHGSRPIQGSYGRSSGQSAGRVVPLMGDTQEISEIVPDSEDQSTSADSDPEILQRTGARQSGRDGREASQRKRADSRGSLVPNWGHSHPGKDDQRSPDRKSHRSYGAMEVPRQTIAKKHKKAIDSITVEKEIFLPLSIRVADLARLLEVKLFKLQRQMETLGLSAQDCHPDNQITSDFSSLIAQEYGLKPIIDEEKSFDIFPDPPSLDPSNLPLRPPVVTIMGHVDHGKTTLLDSLRHTAVAAGEAGGITQHIGAFSVQLNSMIGNGESTSSDASITFLDTPGHAAFSAMRARGAQVTDIVVLVVAADDGVMPQTKEVLRLVQAEGEKVGLVVAINKIDKPGIDLSRIKSALGAEGILLEEDGGDIPSVRVSGLTGLGLPELVETLATVAEVRDLRASTLSKAEGFVLESRIEKGRGNVATVLVARGTLKQGSCVVAGRTWCRIRQMTDDKGRLVKEAGPGMPVTVMGWKELPVAGDELLEALKGEEEAKKAVGNRKRDEERKALMRDVEQINEKRRIERTRLEVEETAKAAAEAAGLTLPTGNGAASDTKNLSAFKELRLILRADVSGTVEAVVGALESIGNKEAGVKIISTGVGDITESDVAMAEAVSGSIIGFSVKAARSVQAMAAGSRVDLHLENVIYRLIETVREKVAALLPPVIEVRVLGEAVVQQIFKIAIKGREPATIAGCRVGNGAISKNDIIRVLRGETREMIHEGTLDSLKHQKKDVTETRKGSECGLSLAGWTEFKEGDVVVAVQKMARPREL